MTPLERIIQQLMGTAQWKRLKMMIQACPHDADREVLFKFIRSRLSANLSDFRKPKP